MTQISLGERNHLFTWVNYRLPIIRLRIRLKEGALTYEAALDKSDIATGGAGFEEMLPLSELFSFEQPLDDLFVICG